MKINKTIASALILVMATLSLAACAEQDLSQLPPGLAAKLEKVEKAEAENSPTATASVTASVSAAATITATVAVTGTVTPKPAGKPDLGDCERPAKEIEGTASAVGVNTITVNGTAYQYDEDMLVDNGKTPAAGSKIHISLRCVDGQYVVRKVIVQGPRSDEDKADKAEKEKAEKEKAEKQEQVKTPGTTAKPVEVKTKAPEVKTRAPEVKTRAPEVKTRAPEVVKTPEPQNDKGGGQGNGNGGVGTGKGQGAGNGQGNGGEKPKK